MFMKENQEDYTRQFKYSALLFFLHILYTSILAFRFRLQINVTGHFSCTYCLISPKKKKILNFNLRFPFPFYSQIRQNAGGRAVEAILRKGGRKCQSINLTS